LPSLPVLVEILYCTPTFTLRAIKETTGVDVQMGRDATMRVCEGSGLACKCWDASPSVPHSCPSIGQTGEEAIG
jgi:hypothetical protein